MPAPRLESRFLRTEFSPPSYFTNPRPETNRRGPGAGVGKGERGGSFPPALPSALVGPRSYSASLPSDPFPDSLACGPATPRVLSLPNPRPPDPKAVGAQALPSPEPPLPVPRPQSIAHSPTQHSLSSAIPNLLRTPTPKSLDPSPESSGQAHVGPPPDPSPDPVLGTQVTQSPFLVSTPRLPSPSHSLPSEPQCPSSLTVVLCFQTRRLLALTTTL